MHLHYRILVHQVNQVGPMDQVDRMGLADHMDLEDHTALVDLVCQLCRGLVVHYSQVDLVGQAVQECQVGLICQEDQVDHCLLYTSPSPRDQRGYRMPSSA